MKKDLLALRGFSAATLFFAGALALLDGAASRGWTRNLVPSPERTAERFLEHLKVGRYPAARRLLSGPAQMTLETDFLRELRQKFQIRHGGILRARGMTSFSHGPLSVALILLRTQDRVEVLMAVPMRQENSLWKVNSLEPFKIWVNTFPSPPVMPPLSPSMPPTEL